jgi:hypothetical protein
MVTRLREHIAETWPELRGVLQSAAFHGAPAS